MELGGATATLTKKLSNGYGVSGRSAYDGVFATPVKRRAGFSSQLDDYREIFCGSEASVGSSIPILELPELNERRATDDARRSKLDYSKVFGGFGNVDSAVSFEELVAQPKEKDSFTSGASARNKVKSTNQSSQEDHTNCSKEIPVVSQSSNNAKRINMSYHKVNQGSENGTNGTTHIAQLHAVPAYTCLVEEVKPVKMNRSKTSIPAAQDTYRGSHCNEEIKERGRRTKSFSGPSPDIAKKQSSSNGVKIKNRSDSVDLFYDACEISNESNGTHHAKDKSGSRSDEGIKEGGRCTKSFTGPSPDNAEKQSSNNGVKVENRSDSIDLFYDACEISNEGNGTHHAEVHPSETVADKLDNHNSDAIRSMATKGQESQSGTSEGAAGADSPSYSDDMVDSNSAAAASVAALRKAIEEAQVRMKVARESMRRKKEGFPDRIKRKSNIDLKAGVKKEAELACKTTKPEEINTRQTFGETDALPQVSSEVGKPMMRVEQVRPDLGTKEMCVAKESVQEAQKKLKSSQAEHMEEVEQKEADRRGKVLELKEAENTKEVLYSKNTGRNASEKPEESDHTIEVVKEYWQRENNEEKVHVDNEESACEEPVHETTHRYQEVADETKLIEETLDNGISDKRVKVNEDGEVQNKVTPFHEPKDYESNLGGQGLVMGNEKMDDCKPEDGKKVEEYFELEECQKSLRAIRHLGEGEKNIAQEQKGSEDEVEVCVVIWRNVN
ncbi:auxilin-like protein [Sesbania bispinosa]|nr:auxilin-like protein [Sesbania bispinosa]